MADAFKVERNPELKTKLERLNRFLIIKFSDEPSERAKAIRELEDDLSVEARAVGVKRSLLKKTRVSTKQSMARNFSTMMM